MTEDDVIADLRQTLPKAGKISEVRMFGGLGFMLNGNMVAAISKRGLLLRVDPDRLAEALALPGTRQMEMRGRLMKGYVYVDSKALNEKSVRTGLRLATDFVATLPAKTAKAKAPRKQGKAR